MWVAAALLFAGHAVAAEYATKCVHLDACDDRVASLERRLSTGDLGKGVAGWMVHREVGKIRLGTAMNRDALGWDDAATSDRRTAVAHLRAALPDAPREHRVELHMAIAEAYEGMEPGTLRILGPLRDVILEDPYAPDARKAHLDRGERLLEHDQLAEAELAFLMGMDRSGDAPDLTAASWFGFCAWQLGRPDEAMTVLRDALVRRVRVLDADLLITNHTEESARLVDWYADLPEGRTDEVLTFFDELTGPAGRRWAMGRLATVRHAQGDWDESDGLHARLAADYPDDDARIAWLAARIDVAAERDDADALELRAREAPGVLARWRDGRAQRVLGKSERTLQHALTAAAKRYVERAQGYDADGYPARAEAARGSALIVYAAFLQAFEGRPEAAAVHQYSAEVNRVLGNADNAFFHYDTALRSDPMGAHGTDLGLLLRGRCDVAAARIRPSRDPRPLAGKEADLVRAADEAEDFLHLTDVDARRCMKAAADVLQDHGHYLEADLRYLPLFEAEGDLARAREVARRVVDGLRDRSKWAALSEQAAYFAGHANLLASEDKAEMQRIAAGAALRRIGAEETDPAERAAAYLAWDRRQGIRVIPDRDAALDLAAQAYDEAGRPDDALAVRRALVARFPESRRRLPALLSLADAALARWDVREAATAYADYADAAGTTAAARGAAHQALVLRQDHAWRRTPTIARQYWERWPTGPERFEVAVLAGDWHAARRQTDLAVRWYARVTDDPASGDLRYAAWRGAGLALYADSRRDLRSAAARLEALDALATGALGQWHATGGSPAAAADLGTLLLDAWIQSAIDDLSDLDQRIREGLADPVRGPVELYAQIPSVLLPRVEFLATVEAPDARRTAAIRVGDAYAMAAARLLDAPIPVDLGRGALLEYVRGVRTKAREWQLEAVDYYAGAVNAAREQGTWDADLDRAIRRMGMFDPDLCGDRRPCRLTPTEELEWRPGGWARPGWEPTL